MKKLWPERVSLELTSRCNLNCIMCAKTNEGGEYIYGDLDEIIFDNLKDSLSNIHTLTLNGHGESLIHPGFLNFMSEMGKTVQRLELTSNGLMINDEVAKSLVRAGLAELTISIHAAEPGLYSEITQNGSLERLIKNISKINEYKKMYGSDSPTLTFQFVSMKKNISQLEKLLELGKQLHVDKLVVLKLHEYELVHGESLDRYPELVRYYLPPAIKYARELGIELLVPSDYIQMLQPKAKPETGKVIHPDRGTIDGKVQNQVRDCLDPWVTLFITMDGEVYPCCNIRESLGNLKNQSLESICFSERLSRLQQNILSMNAPNECSNCSQRGMTTLSTLKFKVALRGFSRIPFVGFLYSKLTSKRLVQSFWRFLSRRRRKKVHLQLEITNNEPR
jgi:radical SAM protein with 4Fe4S-binding SPASM domain